MFNKTLIFLFLFLLISCTPQGGELEIDEETIGTQNSRFPSSKNKTSDLESSALNTGALKIRMGDRHFVSSFLNNLYNCPNDTNKIKNNPNIFGGICDRYNTNGCSLTGINSQSSFTPSSTLRAGITISVCEKLNASSTCVQNLLNQVGLSFTSEYKEENISQVYKLFYPTKEVPKQFNTNVIQYRTVANVADNIKNIQAWKLLTLTLCLSPEWQIP